MTGMDPVVSAYNGDSVSIQEPGLSATTPPGVDTDALANSVCGERGARARFASGRMVSDATVEYLYLCI